MTDIALGAKRYDGANGSALFGGTVPFPPGAMFEADIALIRLYDGSTEVGVTKTLLDPSPLHPDGSLKVVRLDAMLAVNAGSLLPLTLVTYSPTSMTGPAAPYRGVDWMDEPRLLACTNPAYLCACKLLGFPMVAETNPSLPDAWKTLLTTQFDERNSQNGGWPSYGSAVDFAMLDPTIYGDTVAGSLVISNVTGSKGPLAAIPPSAGIAGIGVGATTLTYNAATRQITLPAGHAASVTKRQQVLVITPNWNEQSANYEGLAPLYYRYLMSGNLDHLRNAHRVAVYGSHYEAGDRNTTGYNSWGHSWGYEANFRILTRANGTMKYYEPSGGHAAGEVYPTDLGPKRVADLSSGLQVTADVTLGDPLLRNIAITSAGAAFIPGVPFAVRGPGIPTGAILGATIKGNLAVGSAVITGITAVSGALGNAPVGTAITGAGIPAGTTLLSLDSPTQLTLSAPVTAAATQATLIVSAMFLSAAPTAGGIAVPLEFGGGSNDFANSGELQRQAGAPLSNQGENSSGFKMSFYICYLLSGWLQAGRSLMGWGLATTQQLGVQGGIEPTSFWGIRWAYRLMRYAAPLTYMLSYAPRLRNDDGYGNVAYPLSPRQSPAWWKARMVADIYDVGDQVAALWPAGWQTRGVWGPRPESCINVAGNVPLLDGQGSVALFQWITVFNTCMLAHLNVQADDRVPQQMRAIGELVRSATDGPFTATGGLRQKFYASAYGWPGDVKYVGFAANNYADAYLGIPGYKAASVYTTGILNPLLAYLWALTGDARTLDIVDTHASTRTWLYNYAGAGAGAAYKQMGEVYQMAAFAAAWRAGDQTGIPQGVGTWVFPPVAPALRLFSALTQGGTTMPWTVKVRAGLIDTQGNLIRQPDAVTHRLYRDGVKIQDVSQPADGPTEFTLTIPEPEIVVHLGASALDAAGNESPVTPLDLPLDSVAPAAPAFKLVAATWVNVS